MKSFEPLHAPFLIDSLKVENQVLEGDADEHMLADLERIGLAGVAVLPGPLQYLQLDREVHGPAGIAGLRIAYYDSPLHKAALSALGAEPAAIPLEASISDLNGVAVQPAAIYGNGYHNTAKYTVADTPLWPRPLVAFANTETWTSLPKADRDLITQAAKQARTDMLAALREREQTAIADLCKAGTRMVNLGEDGRARMQQAFAPLLAKLREDPDTRDATAEIEPLATGGQPHRLHCPPHTGSQKAVLTGVFEATLRKTDKGSEAYGEWPADAVKLRLELSDGRAVHTEYLPGGPVNGFNYPYSIFKDVIKFEDPEGVTARWELDGNRLRFSDVDGPAGDKFVWGRTWTKTD